MTMDCTESDDCSPTHSPPASPARPCTASTTGDLLDCDCDCGYITDQTKIQLLTLLDHHFHQYTGHRPCPGGRWTR